LFWQVPAKFNIGVAVCDRWATGESRPALIYEDPSRKVRASESPPSSDAALQGPAHPCDNLGMPPTNLLEDRYRADARCGLQHRHDLAVPNSGERVGTAASSRLLLWEGNRGSASMRYAVAVENPAFAAAMAGALV
jgi:hypothetical protein